MGFYLSCQAFEDFPKSDKRILVSKFVMEQRFETFQGM
jgi:hypothetical protein